MRACMYIFLNRRLGMSTGKATAQGAHAACEAQIISEPKMVDAWRSGGHYMKVVLQADDEAQLTNIETYLKERGFKVVPIIDEGRTEIKPFSKTALGVAVVDKSDQHVIDTFSSFKLYEDLPPAPQPLDIQSAYDYIAACKHLNRKGKDVQRRQKDIRSRSSAMTMTNQELAEALHEPVSEIIAAKQVGRGQICWRRLEGNPDCGCPSCMEKFPGPIRIE